MLSCKPVLQAFTLNYHPPRVKKKTYEISLPESRFLVLDAVVKVRQHVQARRQQLDGRRHDGELALLGLARIADDTDDVAASHLREGRLESVVAAGIGLGVGHHLKSVSYTRSRPVF